MPEKRKQYFAEKSNSSTKTIENEVAETLTLSEILVREIQDAYQKGTMLMENCTTFGMVQLAEI